MILITVIKIKRLVLRKCLKINSLLFKILKSNKRNEILLQHTK